MSTFDRLNRFYQRLAKSRGTITWAAPASTASVDDIQAAILAARKASSDRVLVCVVTVPPDDNVHVKATPVEAA